MNLRKLNRQAYNKIAPHFVITRNRLWPEFNEFSAYIADGQRILDWGCGGGRLLMMLEKKDVSYVGIDQSRQLIKLAKKMYPYEVTTGKAVFYCTALRDKKFPAQYFDLVFMMASFFHLPTIISRKRLLAKTYHELKTGGRLCMTLWNLDSEWANLKKSNWKHLGPHDFLIPWKNASGKLIAERYYHHFTKAEITALLEEAGFVVETARLFDEKNWSDDKGGRNLVIVAKKN